MDFAHDIVPLLRRHCVECHGGDKAEGGFSINSRASFLDDDSATPGNAESSYFLQLMTDPDPDFRMPPADKPAVPKEDIELMHRWVNAGMPWEPGFTFASPRYEPPLRPRRPDLPPPVAGRDHPVDRFLDSWLKERGLPIPEPVDDSLFLRRAFLDLVGLLPGPDTARAFLADPSPDKRERLVRELLADDVAYAEHWLSFWNDLLRNDYTGTGFITGGRKQISAWLYDALVHDVPFDRFARELISPPTDASRGFIDGIQWRGDVSAGQTLPIQFSQSVSQSFLGINMKCASCHDSFIDRWTLQDAYGLAAAYAEEPLPIHRCDKPTGETARAAWLFPELGRIDPGAPRDERLAQLAGLLTHPENGRFTRSIVNRLWARLMGRGLVHPLDAMQSEPWNADLLDFLAVHLQDEGYDLKNTLELIATSRAYQSRCEVVQDGGDPSASGYVYQGPRSKRMTAEQFVDAVWQLTGSAPDRFDAPVARGKVDPHHLPVENLVASWIWGPSAANGSPPPGGERLVFSHEFSLLRPVRAAGVVVTCDNEFTLYVNNQEIVSDADWMTVERRPVTQALREGANRILVVGRNGSDAPNPAGLYLALLLHYESGDPEIISTGPDWRVSSRVPASPNPARWPVADLPWQPATIVPPLAPWVQGVDRHAPKLLAQASSFTPRMVRASLVKNDFLMRSLGRPNRDQIVSTRPDHLTTLEALDLYNNETLAASLAAGGQRLAAREWPSTDHLIEHVFLSTLMRTPTPAERETLAAALGPDPAATSLQDVLWAVCMTPEFFLIR